MYTYVGVYVYIYIYMCHTMFQSLRPVRFLHMSNLHSFLDGKYCAQVQGKKCIFSWGKNNIGCEQFAEMFLNVPR